jgi:hypothetical protein
MGPKSNLFSLPLQKAMESILFLRDVFKRHG